MCSTPSAFSVFLEQQLRELHHQLVEKHEELLASILEDAPLRAGLLGRLQRADSKKTAKLSVLSGSYSNIWGSGIPGAVDPEDVSSYSSVSEVYDMNYQRQSLLSRTSNTDVLQHLQQLHSMQMARETSLPSSSTSDRADVHQVFPEVRPLRRTSGRGRMQGGSLKLTPRTLMSAPGEGSTVLGDLGIIPRSRRKSDFAGAPSVTISDPIGRPPDVSLPVVHGWLPLPAKVDSTKDVHLDRVSENSISQMSSSMSGSPRRSSKVLRAEALGAEYGEAAKADDDPEALKSNFKEPRPEAEPRCETGESAEDQVMQHHVKFPAVRQQRRHSDAAASVASFFSTPFFRGDSRMSLEGPGCEPLTDDFDYEFELLPCWNRTAKHSAKVTKFHRLVTRSSLSKHFGDFPDNLDEGEAVFVIKPFSAKKMAWDLVICCIVLHDGIVLPLQLLGIQVSTSDSLAWPLTLVWTADLMVSSVIAHERNDGTWETRVRYTFQRYLTGSFLPDFGLAAMAWVERFINSQSFKFLRICRLFRLYRIEAIIQLISNNIRSERAVLCIGISGKILWLAVFLHFIACLWLSLGRQDGGWVSYHRPGTTDIQQYSIAFHWTLAQFHGSMELYPVTVEERIFAFCYLLMAYILAVVFISSMTSAMTRLHLITGIQAGHQRVLRWFLIDNRISRQLTARIHYNLKAALTAQSHAVPESEVEFLQMVSENLRMELHCEMYGPALQHHPLLEPINAQLVKQLCHTAISMALISYGDLVFIQGEVPVEPRMVFVTDGELTYFRSGKYESIPVHHDQCAAEPVLWTDWLHHGTLRVASMRVRLLLLSAKTFQELALKNTCPEIDLFAYAAEFVRQFNELQPVDRHDLWCNIDLTGFQL